MITRRASTLDLEYIRTQRSLRLCFPNSVSSCNSNCLFTSNVPQLRSQTRQCLLSSQFLGQSFPSYEICHLPRCLKRIQNFLELPQEPHRKDKKTKQKPPSPSLPLPSLPSCTPAGTGIREQSTSQIGVAGSMCRTPRPTHPCTSMRNPRRLRDDSGAFERTV